MITHFHSLSVEAMERRGGKEGMGRRHEVVKAKNLSGREQSARLKSACLSQRSQIDP